MHEKQTDAEQLSQGKLQAYLQIKEFKKYYCTRVYPSLHSEQFPFRQSRQPSGHLTH